MIIIVVYLELLFVCFEWENHVFSKISNILSPNKFIMSSVIFIYKIYSFLTLVYVYLLSWMVSELWRKFSKLFQSLKYNLLKNEIPKMHKSFMF